MKFKNFLKTRIAILLLTCSSGMLLAQNLSIQGLVVGADNEPLIGVSIVEKGTTNGVITNVDGQYNLTNVSTNATLVYSFIGLLTQEVAVNGQTTINITMQEDSKLMDEVVVIGYGEAKVKDLTSAIVTIKSEELEKTPAASPMQALQGKVAGVQITSNGAPGGQPTVRIRGVGSFQSDAQGPLYVVDGMFFSTIDFLNPSDIASMSVLKDASAAAIYGVRAANGVILISTKSGGKNKEATVTYDGYYGVQHVQNLLPMANAQEYTTWALESGSSADKAIIDNAMQKYGRSRIDPNIPDVNTDWYVELVKKAAPIQNHSVGISGGTQKASYSAGASYFSQEGLLEDKEKYERFNLRTKVDFDAKEWLKIGGSVIVSSGKKNEGANNWNSLYYASPIVPVYDENNTRTDANGKDLNPNKYASVSDLGYSSFIKNPAAQIAYQNDNRTVSNKVLYNAYAQLNILPQKLTFKTAFNQELAIVQNRNVGTDIYLVDEGQQRDASTISKKMSFYNNYIWDNTINYREQFAKHGVGVLLGTSFRSSSSQWLQGDGEDLPVAEEEYWYLSNANALNDPTDGGGASYGASYFSRLSYNYSEKYLLYFTMRADGSSKYQEKWGYFPSVGAGWIMSDESFMADIEEINFLKLRAGWGQLGNDGVPANAGFASIETGNIARPGFGNTWADGYIASNYYSALQWEVSEELNIGLTSSFLKNRLSLEADWYQRNTLNAVVNLPIPSSDESLLQNVGELRNSGFEMAIGWSDKIGDISYSVSGNMSTLKNQITSLNGLNELPPSSRTINRVGESFQSFYGYKVIGVYQTPEQLAKDPVAMKGEGDAASLEAGDFMYQDTNGDGIISGEDRVVLGSYFPNLTYGANLAVGYKGLELSVALYGQSGNSILNDKRSWVDRHPDINPDQDLATNRWHGEGTSNSYPSAKGIRKGWNARTNSFFIEDGSYFRIQNVQLAYTFKDKSLFEHMPKTKLYFTADRPYTNFAYNGFSPEVASGIDSNTYPISASYTMGLKVNF